MTTESSQSGDAASPGCGFVNGDFVPIEEASIPLLDWGFNKSDVVYDGIPFTEGRLFRLNDHLDRFAESMRKWRLRAPYARDQIEAICHDLVSRSTLRDGIVYVCTTRGLPPSAEIRDPTRFENRMYGWSQELPKLGTDQQLLAGLNLIVSSIPRIPQQSVDSTAKNFHWGDLIQARLEAADRGAQNALLLSYDGSLAEGVGFNVFVVKDQKVATPSRDCLHGITRQTVLEIAADFDLAATVCEISREELDAADEVFITSSAGGVFAVTIIDGQSVGDGLSGEKTQKIREEYWRRRVNDKWSTPVDYGATKFNGGRP